MISAEPAAAAPPPRPATPARASRRAAFGATAVLGLLYTATAAPSITWWDAGEFIAAVDTLGIPHPPGTPLYILMANVWSTMLWMLDVAHAVNLFSAACTAAAGGAAAWLISRATRSAVVAVAAALCAGTMATVWASATEAEVYGPALLLAMLMLLAGDRTGRTGDARFVVLTAYLFALAAPLHVIALVAGPAALVLASTRPDGGLRGHVLACLAAALVTAGAIGTGRWALGAAGFIALIVSVVVMREARVAPAAMAIAFSGFAVMLARAQFDPGINQGNPATVQALLGVIAREQYTIAGLFPRQAPVWLQVVNVLEYADWQVALGLGPTVAPTAGRTLTSMAYVALGVFGFVVHRRADPRTWRALAVLALCGSLGVIAYLNLKAGPSIGYGILPDDAPHEPRERDYFFAFAFWSWGLWAGIGATAVAARWRPARPRAAIAIGLAIATLPAVLNWPATTRRREPEASLPRRFAEELLHSAPPRAMLLVAGDNDTYPLWYLQQVEGVRPDVAVVTYPLLGAGWYRDELHRRVGLGTPPPHDGWQGMRRELSAIAGTARDQARPVAVAVTVDRAVRELLAPRWRLAGLVYLPAADSDAGTSSGPRVAGSAIVVDTQATEVAASRIAPLLRRELRRTIDPTGRLMRGALTCPSVALRASSDSTAAGLLESACNSR